MQNNAANEKREDKKEKKQDEIITSSFDNQSRDTSKVVKLDLSHK